VESKILKTALLLFFLFFLAVPIYPLAASESYTLYGAYGEDGYLEPSGIWVTFFREGQGQYKFFLNGTQTVTATQTGEVFKFDLGYNMSRTYYVYGNETIYVIVPEEPFYVYYFEVVDFVGVEWGYLESFININGTDRVVERWDVVNVTAEFPLTFTWGNAYKIRLVCSQGTYVYGSYVAGGTSEYTLSITQDMFPQIPTDRAFSIGASRTSDTNITAYYNDPDSLTNWIYFEIFKYGEASATYTYNTTSNTITLVWDEAASGIDYYCKITVNHQLFENELIYSYACPYSAPESLNPWEFLNDYGSLPFDASQLPALIIIVCVFGVFSWASAPIGIIFTSIIAVLLRWLNWFDVDWIWLGISVPLAWIIAFIMWKERERSI